MLTNAEMERFRSNIEGSLELVMKAIEAGSGNVGGIASDRFNQSNMGRLSQIDVLRQQARSNVAQEA